MKKEQAWLESLNDQDRQFLSSIVRSVESIHADDLWHPRSVAEIGGSILLDISERLFPKLDPILKWDEVFDLLALSFVSSYDEIPYADRVRLEL